MTVDRHDEHADNVAAYLLGALNELERQAFERHLAHCTECRSEIEELRPALEALPRSVPPVAPPPSLKASLMETVEREAREQAAPAPARIAGACPSRACAPPWRGPAPPPCSPSAWPPASGSPRSTTTRGVPHTVAASVDAARLPDARADLAIAPDRSSAILRVRGMPRLPDDRVYQVWIKRGQTIEPDALFRVDRSGRGSAAVDRSLDDADAVMVTREPAAGSATPSEQPVIVVPT